MRAGRAEGSIVSVTRTGSDLSKTDPKQHASSTHTLPYLGYALWLTTPEFPLGPALSEERPIHAQRKHSSASSDDARTVCTPWWRHLCDQVRQDVAAPYTPKPKPHNPAARAVLLCITAAALRVCCCALVVSLWLGWGWCRGRLALRHSAVDSRLLLPALLQACGVSVQGVFLLCRGTCKKQWRAGQAMRARGHDSSQQLLGKGMRWHEVIYAAPRPTCAANGPSLGLCLQLLQSLLLGLLLLQERCVERREHAHVKYVCMYMWHVVL